MPRPAFAESLLALFAGRERAAAIYGDLTEMAATRGRLWFFAAYARTLVALTWRMAVAFVAGFAAFVLGDHSVGTVMRLFGMRSWERGRYFANISAHRDVPQIVFLVLVQFWFLAAFAVVRYGVRDRVARLALALFAILACACMNLFLSFSVTVFLASFALVSVLASYLSDRWRGAAITVSATAATGAVMWANLTRLAGDFSRQHPNQPHVLWAGVVFLPVWLLIVAVMTWICTRLHRRLVGNEVNAGA